MYKTSKNDIHRSCLIFGIAYGACRWLFLGNLAKKEENFLVYKFMHAWIKVKLVGKTYQVSRACINGDYGLSFDQNLS